MNEKFKYQFYSSPTVIKISQVRKDLLRFTSKPKLFAKISVDGDQVQETKALRGKNPWNESFEL